MHIGIGFSKTGDSFSAAKEAALLAKIQLKQEKASLALIFFSIHYSGEEILRGAKEVLPETKIIGCSTAGIILSSGLENQGVALLLIFSEELNLGLGLAEDIVAKGERLKGQALAKSALESLGAHKKSVFMMLSDGLIANGSELARGVQDVLGNSFPFIGGASSDDFNFKQTFQLFQNRVLTNSAVGILFGGEINFGLGTKHGWSPLGKPRVATLAEGNILREIDGAPAIKIYEEYFGKDIEELYKIKLATMAILYPLGVYVAGEKEYLLRNAIDVTRDGALICHGEIPQGAEIRLMMGNKDACLAASKEAAQEVIGNMKGKIPKVAIVFNSISRQKILGKLANKEIEIVKSALGGKTPVIGFYTYGEDAPLKALHYFGQTYFHNETIAILGISN